MPRFWLAPAKLNLYLHVIGQRPDGYHRLDSLVAFADIGDRLAVAPAPRLSLTLEGPFAAALAGEVESNLVWRAASLLAQRLGRRPEAAITLIKNLPVAAGLGGGSSDAAAALRSLLSLWKGMKNEDELGALAEALGADVSVCLAQRTCWIGGIGERVEPAAPLPEVHVVLANPGLALATKTVFAARRGGFSQPAQRFEAPADAAHLAALLSARRNDLAPAAIGLAPVIAQVLARLQALEGALIARMSGSGATCFALFATPAAAAAAAQRLSAEEASWWVAAGRLI